MKLIRVIAALILLAAVPASADEFKKKIKVGKKMCSCSFNLIVEDSKLSPNSKASCDKKCNGMAKGITLEGPSGIFTFGMKVSKGRVQLIGATVTTPTTEAPTTVDATETTEGTTGDTTTDSGTEETTKDNGTEKTTDGGTTETTKATTDAGTETASTQTAPGSNGPGSGGTSGPVGPGPGKDGLDCSCKCDCPKGQGQCDCSCNCPMLGSSMVCAPGFTQVCPMNGMDCPTDTEKICPKGAGGTAMRSLGRMETSRSGCQCIPDFLMSLMKEKARSKARVRSAPDMFKNQKIRIGKITCTCSLKLIAAGGKIHPKSQAKCDKGCTGSAKGVVLTGKSGNVYTMALQMKKGKGKVSGTVKASAPSTPKPTPPPKPKPTAAPGTGESGGFLAGPACACVQKKDGSGGTGGEGGAPSESTGATKKVVPWFLGMEPLEFCVETGTEVVFNKTGHNVVPMATQADYDACTGFLGDNPLVGNNVDPWIEKMDSDGIYYFACGVGTHCSAGGMKAKITVAPSCAKSINIPWTFGMQKQEICVGKGTKVIFDKTGSFHNVNVLSNQVDYDGCTGFTDTSGNSDPFSYEADTVGTFYFACGVGAHCSAGGMKAKITVSDSC